MRAIVIGAVLASITWTASAQTIPDRPPTLPITLALTVAFPDKDAGAVILTNRGPHGNVILLREAATGEDVAAALVALFAARRASMVARGHTRIVVPRTSQATLSQRDVGAAAKWLARARTNALTSSPHFGTARTVYFLARNAP